SCCQECSESRVSAPRRQTPPSVLALENVPGGTMQRNFAAELESARATTDKLFSLLAPGALYERPIPERHRLIFYLGHLEAFDWNLIAVRGFGVEPFHSEFDKLFAFGIDPVDGGLPREPASDWPDVASVLAYGARVRDIVDECLSGARVPPEGTDLDTIVNMAIEHRLMHAETLAYLFHQLPYTAKIARPDPPPPPRPGVIASRVVPIPAGEATLGQSREDRLFGWDNEFERTRVPVPAFSIDSHKVTN